MSISVLRVEELTTHKLQIFYELSSSMMFRSSSVPPEATSVRDFCWMILLGSSELYSYLEPKFIENYPPIDSNDSEIKLTTK